MYSLPNYHNHGRSHHIVNVKECLPLNVIDSGYTWFKAKYCDNSSNFI